MFSTASEYLTPKNTCSAAPVPPLPSQPDSPAQPARTLPALGALFLRVLNQAMPATRREAAPVVSLAPGQVNIEEIPASACNDAAQESGDFMDVDLDCTRLALSSLTSEYAQIPEGPVRSRYQSQIEKLELVLLAGTTDDVSLAKVDAEPVTALEPYVSPVEERSRAPVEEAPTRALPMRTLAATFSDLKKEVSRVMSLSPAASNDAALAIAPLRLPTFAGLAQASRDGDAAKGLLGTLGLWCSTQIDSVQVRVARNIALQSKINQTPQPDPYTKLEQRCLEDAPRSPFTRLIKPSSVTVIQNLLANQDRHSNPNAGSYGPAHLAVVNDHPRRLEALLRSSAGKIDVDHVSSFYKATALELAAEHQNRRCADVLIRHGAMPTARAFERLADHGNVGMFLQFHAHWKTLTDRNISPKRPAEPIDFRATLATAINSNALELVRFLFDQGVRPGNKVYLLLQLAAHKGSAEMLGLLLRHVPSGLAQPPQGADPDQSPWPSPWQADT